MRIFVRFILFVFCVSMFSCSEKSPREVLLLKEYDSLTISIDYPLLPSYGKLVPYKKGNDVYAVGYNRHLHSLDFINLSGGEHETMEFQREGADATLVPKSFGILDSSVVWNDANGIVLLTMDGKVFGRVSQKDILSPEGRYLIKPKGVTNANYSSLGVNGNEVFIPLTPQSSRTDVCIGKVYNVDSREMTELPLEYPDEILEHIDLIGGLSFPYIQSYGDKMVYNFPCSSKYFVYDKENGKTYCFNMESLSVTNEIDGKEYENLPPRQKFEMESMASRFDKVYYNNMSQRYYRIHYAQKEKLFDKNRKMFLMVYDVQSDMTKEYQLPSTFSEEYIMVGNSAYFFNKDSDDEQIRLAKVDLMAL